ncbi:unnamed protein product [Durusdinium trenchii]|uniref:Beta-galactosidase n=1 Tax=Durusdinium trenchii TaxID=1381693 RepID=A0ABP0HRG3_9DINO
MGNSKIREKSALLTPWGSRLTETPWSEYPRPQLRRDSWRNLNGLWRCRIIGKESGDQRQSEHGPQDMLAVRDTDQQILVPFCLESTLGGVGQRLDPNEELWYHRTFNMEKLGSSKLLLHFEAVDYRTTVWLNGILVGKHLGGFSPFEFDITEAVRDSNDLVVLVTDATGNFQLRGKQSKSPHGIWYSRVSGIWQTVWLETVPPQYIKSLRIDSTLDPPCMHFKAAVEGENLELRVVVEKEGDPVEVTGSCDAALHLPFPGAKLWSPQQPYLYTLNLELLSEGVVVDRVQSYTGIRTIGKRQDQKHWRITLNNEICFHLGPLDQGWWPDGLLTAPSDEAMRSDIEFLKQAGFNMIRKHVKVEPRRYYYHCDVLGILVWQDQVSGTEKEGDCFKVPPWSRLEPNGQEAEWPEWARTQFLAELQEMVEALYSSPAIAVWVPFNEAWGQHDTEEIAKWLQSYDCSRLINIASGGNFFAVGDIVDHHNYPEPTFPIDARFQPFIKVVGEFGGHGLVLGEEHLWQTARKNWGYNVLKDIEELEVKYESSMQSLCDWMCRGIAAGVYTQTTDVECEVNGLLSYDRKVQKLAPAFLSKVHSRLWDKCAQLAARSGAQPFREPDPLILDMLSGTQSFGIDMVTPALHKIQHASAAPNSCQKDATKHCSTARSQVHCLGQHRDDISDDCRRDLGKSVPFVCSAAIDKHCDVLHVGILDCLQKYESELSGDCKDAFLATSKVVSCRD